MIQRVKNFICQVSITSTGLNDKFYQNETYLDFNWSCSWGTMLRGMFALHMVHMICSRPGIHGPDPVGPGPSGSVLVLGLEKFKKSRTSSDQDRGNFGKPGQGFETTKKIVHDFTIRARSIK